MFPDYLEDIVLPFLEDLRTPRSLTVKLLIEHGEFDQLVALTVDPAHYLDHDSFYRDVIATELLRKCADLPTKVDRREAAREAFDKAEKLCFVTNERLLPLVQHLKGFNPLIDRTEWLLLDFLKAVKKRIARVLGRLPDVLDGRHGPGATFADKGKFATIPHKMESRPSITPAARCILPFWYETIWARGIVSGDPYRSDPVSVPGNRFVTVPKDATKDRGIAIEPSLNVYFQLGLGRVIRNRLKRVGYDLDEGQSLHRHLACRGSRDGSLATIDLSSASDTVSYRLVEILLPSDWFEALASLRSPKTLVDGKWHCLQKFSSMGNGFTFELETLIFSQICEEVVARNGGGSVHCYGDDIIVPSVAAAEVIGALGLCGFRANPRKTYASGLFRESCGGDFFNGLDSRGYYLKSYPSSPDKLMSFHNGLKRLIDNLGISDRVLRMIRSKLPSDIRRVRGPKDLGDLVLHEDNVRLWSTRTRDSIRYIRVYRPVGRTLSLRRFSPATQLASALYGIPSTGVTPRGSVSGFRLGWSAFS